MEPEREAGMNRVLDTLQVPRIAVKGTSLTSEKQHAKVETESPVVPGVSPGRTPPVVIPSNGPSRPNNRPISPVTSSSRDVLASQQVSSSGEPWYPSGLARGAPDNQNFADLGFTLPTAESLGTLCAKINRSAGMPVGTGSSLDSSQLRRDMAQQPGLRLGQLAMDREQDSDSDEENEAESHVIEQLSNRIGTLKIAGDGHLRFYGATSNLNLVDESATQQRQRPDARTVRHDGQDILNHLRVGQPVDQALENHLVELYFTWQNPSIYVVDKEMYMMARSKWRDEYDDTPFYSEVLTNAM